MPSSLARSFADPDEFASSIRATRYEMTVTGRGRFAAELIRIDLHDLWMQRFSTNLPWISHAENMRGRAVFVFRTQAGPELLRGGEEMRPTVVARLAEAQMSYQRASGPVSWAAMSLPLDATAATSAAMAGIDITPPQNVVMLASAPPRMERLRQLHAAAGHLAQQAPEIIANPAAARGLEEELVRGLTACFRKADSAEDRAAKRRHAVVMKRFRAVVEARGNEPIYLSELCAALNVSDRTLRVCCQEHLGMGPIRYLWLRRMQLARRALTDGSLTSGTVTDIATAHGFWELGRFAVAYRALYGESPSGALRRARAGAC
ncbi:MAG TPA: helix-turn-helix transcriptional regulator [Acetobacteraceae bacterium]|nr:helix-turn-helix transcriptional regulator [Acetobacteraceae bacterium]